MAAARRIGDVWMRFAVRGGFEGLLDGEPWAGRLLVSAELAALILEGDSEVTSVK